ncbi:tRNA (uridine(54)-C5)-methyltransferase TrmA [Orbus sasakiae]|uniref:tRNA/tmRNA (uracil-C(5))-methyltransferase n=1 Tax=Orbus sasakiae TaxID=1078475 RepID=A0ABP9N1F3_9GAMM
MPTSLPEDNYQHLLDEKVKQTQTLFAPFALPQLTVYPSPPRHYRMRAEFRIWQKGEDIYHVMYDQKTRQRIRVEHFPVATKIINDAMTTLIALLKPNDILRYKLFQVDYLSSLSGQLIITLLYHRRLAEDWQVQARLLKEQLITLGFDVNIVGRASNQKISVDKDYVYEKLPILGRDYTYQQIENSFTQPNAHINIDMLSWVINLTKNATDDLLELYCGNGNFSIALAQNFRQVIATEVAKTSVKSALHNIEINHADNVNIVRLSAEEFTQAIHGERDFKRLNGIRLSDYTFNTVLVDPPRSGLDNETLAMVAKYRTIIYISCNPLSLKDNLSFLSKTHKIEHAAVFDQFPYTKHLEIGMVLSKIDR